MGISVLCQLFRASLFFFFFLLCVCVCVGGKLCLHMGAIQAEVERRNPWLTVGV